MIQGFQGTYKDVDFFLRKSFALGGRHVVRGEWQALQDDRPQMSTVELYDISIDMNVPDSVEQWQEDCQPNLPWAEDHFQERVGSIPLNPGKQYKNWPWYEQGVEEHKQTGLFSHTYMERMWAGFLYDPPPTGVRYEIGDITDLVYLLNERPMTRQAFLPIWFPEDLHAAFVERVRVPCSLGYLFQVQDNTLHCYYYLRSCDFIRYLWDDLYMAGRLLQWVVERSNVPYPVGTLHAKIANLHIFQPEFKSLETSYQQEMQERLTNAF